MERMTTGKKVAMGVTAALLLAVGIELLWLHHERNLPAQQAVTRRSTGQSTRMTWCFLRHERPSKLADLKDLYGKTVWVAAGGQMDYYPYAAHHADYAKAAGTLLGAEPLVVKDAFEQVAPKSATLRIPGGTRQVLLAFTMPKSADPAKEYAVPVGYRQGRSDYTFYTDDLFYYDDPHTLYKYWGPQSLAGNRLAPGDPGNERAPGGAVARPGVQERKQRVRQPAGGVLEHGPSHGRHLREEPGYGVPAGPGILRNGSTVRFG